MVVYTPVTLQLLGVGGLKTAPFQHNAQCSPWNLTRGLQQFEISKRAGQKGGGGTWEVYTPALAQWECCRHNQKWSPQIIENNTANITNSSVPRIHNAATPEGMVTKVTALRPLRGEGGVLNEYSHSSGGSTTEETSLFHPGITNWALQTDATLCHTCWCQSGNKCEVQGILCALSPRNHK